MLTTTLKKHTGIYKRKTVGDTHIHISVWICRYVYIHIRREGRVKYC